MVGRRHHGDSAGFAREAAGPWPGASIVGPLARYWQERYGFPAANIVVWSGDNPCSLIGVGLVREGRLAVSLGTSDTVFGLMREPRVDTLAPATCSARRPATSWG